MISVIVPVRNESLYLAGTLDQLLAQDYPGDRFEVLVIDGQSTDRTHAIAQAYGDRYRNFHVFENPKRLASAARNVGVRHAAGDYVVVVDGHCELTGPGFLRKIADAFEKSGADCLGRPQPLNVTGATLLQKAIAGARASWLGHHPATFNYETADRFVPAQSVAVAYRRSLFDEVGPFDESFDACEDVELNHRIDLAGLRCYYSPALAVKYFPRTTLRGLFKQMARYGKGRVRLARKHRETLSLGSFAPAVWLAGLVLGPLCGLAWPPFWIVYAVAVLLYGAMIVSASLPVALKNRDIRYLAAVPAVFVTLHAGTGYGVLRELARPSKP